MKKKYIQPDVKEVRIMSGFQLLSGSPVEAASTNVEGLEGYDSNGGDASGAW